MADDDSTKLLTRWQHGDQQAAAELFQRFAGRLIGLVRQRLSAKLAQRLDPEDVVQSAYRSFFAGAREGNYHLQCGGDLWRLLVAITLHKLQHQFRRHAAQKRDAAREQSLGEEGDENDFPAHLLAREPSPLEAVALVDEVTHAMKLLTPPQRRVLELRLQGYSVDELAAETGRNVLTMYRVLNQIKRELERWRQEVAGA